MLLQDIFIICWERFGISRFSLNCRRLRIRRANFLLSTLLMFDRCILQTLAASIELEKYIPLSVDPIVLSRRHMLQVALQISIHSP